MNDIVINFIERFKSLGYTYYPKQVFKNEHHRFWKSFYINGEKVFQIGILLYDYSKYDINNKRVGIQYECLLIGDDRLDLSVSKNIDINKFEEIAFDFYESMKKYL